MHNIDQMDFWSLGKGLVISTREFYFFLNLVLVLT